MILGSYSNPTSCSAASNSVAAFGSFCRSQIAQVPAWNLTNLFSVGQISAPLPACEIFPLIVALERSPPVIPPPRLGSAAGVQQSFSSLPCERKGKTTACADVDVLWDSAGKPLLMFCFRISQVEKK